MNILIIGCRRAGSSLANRLDQLGHDVSVVDADPETFEFLDSAFTGFTLAGNPIDQETLRAAGIEGCDAAAAVTPDDNTNIMAAQLAAEIFHVPKVIARVTDPDRETIYSRMGMITVCPTNLSVHALSSALLEDSDVKQLSFDNATVSFSRIHPSKGYLGRTVGDLTDRQGEEQLFAIQRPGEGIYLASQKPYWVIEQEDYLIFAQVID